MIDNRDDAGSDELGAPSAGQPTEAFDFPAAEQPTEAFDVAGAERPTEALDALFGDDKFRDYLAEPAPSENPFKLGDNPIDVETASEPAGISTTQKTLMWVAGSLVAAFALVALFLVGTRLPALIGPEPAAEPSVAPSVTPTAGPLPIGPADPGTHAWDGLLGGECLDPYDGAWEEEYTVVDCAEPHPAQLVLRGQVPQVDEGRDAYPGIADLQSRMSLLCTPGSVIDYGAAAAYTDIQFEASFPATKEAWDEGRRDYFCFVSRSSGELLTGSLAVPPPVEAPSEG